MSTILIKNGKVVTDSINKKDILIKDGVIAKIEDKITDKADEVIDAAGLAVMPGFVDMHCHLREPGYEYKEDIVSGTHSAVRGGFTSVACMPNTMPVIDNAYLAKYVAYRAKEAGYCKVYPIAAATKSQQGKELTPVGSLKKAGVVAISDDGKPIESAVMMRNVLEYATGFDMTVISHCEVMSLAEGGCVNEGYNSTIAGLRGIPRVAEEAMIARDVLLAEYLGAKLHIAHVSTANGVDIIRAAKKKGVKVTAETCPHYISLTDDEILGYDTNAKINPPLRLQSDIAALKAGLLDGTIDAIATDHAPHGADEKKVEFPLAPFGSIGFETAFGVCYTHLVKSGETDLPTLVKLMSENPARILGVSGGKLAVGEPADIAIADLDAEYIVGDDFYSKSKNSAFIGKKLCGKIVVTVVDGKIAYREA